MIVALILGRGGSTGLPGKNVMPIVGRPLMAYPLLAAKHSKYCDKVFLSTDDEEIRKVGDQFGVHHIERPDYLAIKEALAEDAYIHGYQEIKKIIGQVPELIILLFCNGATVLSQYLDEAVEVLQQNPDLDSACTASCYNMWSPLRAKKIDEKGRLVPFIPPSFLVTKLRVIEGRRVTVGMRIVPCLLSGHIAWIRKMVIRHLHGLAVMFTLLNNGVGWMLIITGKSQL